MTSPGTEPTTSGHANAEPLDGDVLSGSDVGARVVLGSLQRAGGFAALNLVSAVGAVLVLRHLGVDNWGRFGTVMALLTIVQGVSDAGLSMTGSRELSINAGDAARRDVLGHLIGLRIILTGTGVLLACCFALAVGYSTTMVEGTALAGGGVFLLSVQSALLLPLVVTLQNWRLAVNDVLRQVVLVGCFVVLVLVGASLLPFFGASLVAALVVLALTPVLLLERHHLVRPRWTPARLRSLMVKTLPLSISGVLSVVYFRILVILMSVLEPSARQVGYYVTSARILEALLALPLTLVGVVLPVLSVSAQDNEGRLQYVTMRLTQVMLILGVLLAVVLTTGARPVILVIGGRQYLGAASVLRIQCIVMVTFFVSSAWVTTLVGMGRTRSLATATGIGVASVTIFGAALILPFAATGAAVAAVAADVVLCGAFYVSLRRTGAAAALSAGPLIRILVCAAPGLALSAVSPAPPIVNCVVATALFVVLLFPARAIPPEIVDFVRSSVRSARPKGSR